VNIGSFLGRVGILGLLLAASMASAQLNPLTIVGKVVSTSLDVRTKDEVKNDTSIAASANKRLLDDKRADWRGVSLLVFAQHVVLAGAVKSEDVKKIVEKLVREDKRIRTLVNAIVVVNKPGDEGSLVKDTAKDTSIDATLTTAKGISSVNMRWKSVAGNVVLMGVAQSKEEAQLAVAKIKALDGVKSVKSHLRIVPKPG
jgi:hyperosmotically inducible periplasmic protein